MKIVIATNNRHKFSEIKELLSDCNLEIKPLWKFPLIPPIREDGKTFCDNAKKKALTVSLTIKMYALGDDSGLEVDYLNGSPGIFSSRFAHDFAKDEENNQKLLNMLKDVPMDKRGARFICCMALSDYKGNVATVKGVLTGKITTKIHGCEGFGYDPLFIPDGYSETVARLGGLVKKKISHRALALQKIKQLLLEVLDKGYF